MVTEDENNNKGTSEDTSIPEEDIGATIAMTGPPMSIDIEDEKVRASLDSFFEDCGSIKRVIFQEDGGQQHAVVVFESVDSIGPAVALSSSVFLGSNVSIVSAAGSNPDAETTSDRANGDLKDDGSTPSNEKRKRRSIGSLVKSSVATALATGFVFSTTVDNKYKISNTVSKGMKDIDEAYKVTQAVNDLTNIARTHATSIDNQYGISKKTKEIGSNLHEQAKTGFNTAMQHETVRKTWGFATNLLSTVSKAVTQTVKETQEMTKEKINEKLPTAQTPNEDETEATASRETLLTTTLDDNSANDGAVELDEDTTTEESVPL